MIIRTPRLDLVPATASRILAEMEGPQALARALAVRVGSEWPPPLFDAEAVEWSLDQVSCDPEFEEWGMRYLVLRAGDKGGPEAVGVAGFKGPPGEEHEVEIGYSVIPRYQRRGFATEAVLALVDHAFGEGGVERVTALTLPHLFPSLGVLAKTGFAFESEVPEEGAVRYVRRRIR